MVTSMQNKTIIGITLFSVLQKKSHKYVMLSAEHDKYIETLFSKSRLDLKSDIFFNLSLPQLNMMDKLGCSYFHFLVYSKELPQCYKNKIIEAGHKYDFLIPIEVIDYDSFNLKETLKPLVERKSYFALFSLDDDDLISVDYLSKIKRYIDKPFLGFNISLSKGYTGFYDGSLKNCREVRFPFINIGQARICESDENGKIFIPKKGSHMKTDEFCPTIVDSREVTFFWFKHLVQDTFSKTELHKAISKIRHDLDSYSHPSEAVTLKFPALLEVIEERDYKDLFLKHNILLEKRKQSVSIFEKSNMRVDGKIIVDYTLRNLGGASKKQALAVFKLSCELSEEDVGKSGLSYSNIGYYKYFNTESEFSEGSFSIDLPDYVILENIEVMKWGDEVIELEKIAICKEQKDI